MAEYVYAAEQTVPYGQAVIFNDSISCPNGYVLHENESGIFNLRGVVKNPCGRFARYRVTFVGNIAVPTGGTVGEISLSVATMGEPAPASLSAITPTVVNAYGNVTCTKYITVPCGCCWAVSIENTSATAEPILVRNANLVITREA